MQRPIAGQLLVTQGFGGNKFNGGYSYFNGTETIIAKGHTGLDINAPVGTQILAVYNGTVKVRSPQPAGLGTWLSLYDPLGRQVDYGHLSTILVADGASVKAGDVIALSGSSGNSTGPHLHLQVRNSDYDVHNCYDGYHDFIQDFNANVRPDLSVNLF